MAVADWFRPPRHLLAMFFAITLVSAVTLGWLGWQLVRQDRDVAGRREDVLRENATNVIVAALQGRLSEIERQLSTLADLQEPELSRRAADYAGALAPDSVLLVFDPVRADAYPAKRLLYYPDASSHATLPSGVFDEADALEYGQGSHTSVVRVLRTLSASPSPLIRAEALMRLGRTLRQASSQEALAAYEQLARLGDVPTQAGVPAELMARGEMISLLGERHAGDRRTREAEALYGDLRGARWRITRSVYDHYAGVLGANESEARSGDPAVLAEVAYELWDAWRDRQVQQPSSPHRTYRIADRSVLVVQRQSVGRLIALAVGPGTIASTWLTDERIDEGDSIRIALIDEHGPVVGAPDTPPGRHSQRLGTTTGLPWSLYVVSNATGMNDTALSTRSHFVLTTIGAIAVLVLGGSYLIGRAVARELAVARLQSDFVSAVSHEFRTPLTVLRQLSELLVQDRIPNDSVRREYYAVLQRESGRLHRLVEGLLKFGRMEAGAVRYQFGTVDTAEFLRTLVAEFSRDAERRGCRIELATTGPAARLRADREALSCVIWNLLDNAIKYSPDCRTVWVELSTQDGHVAIRVRDRGVGIPIEDRQRIFEKFVRGDVATTLGVQGTGIGLAVARQIIQRHGGGIRVESEVGKGSTFTVVLPADPAPEEALAG